jgi:hypothetical protein
MPETVRSEDGITFTVFEPGRNRVRDTSRATITKAGILSLNRPAMEDIGNPKHVELLYAEAERIIALRPADPDSPRAIKVTPLGDSSTHTMAGRSFLNYHGIPYETTRRYLARKSGDMLLIDLKEGGVEAGRDAANPKKSSNEFPES